MEPQGKRPPDLRRQNRKLGLILGGVAASIFALAVIITVLIHYAETSHAFPAH
ncbi:MAG TPA: hypothetical protein VMV79_07930 [Alphaproteobacteria bacterium]|nr:hypothetical protein [Alphaproteobacteria bacterium]